MEYLNRPFSPLNLAQKNIGNWEEGFANASDSLETWDDSDSITAVNAQKIWDIHKDLHSHLTTSYQGSGSTDNILEVVETEQKIETNNPTSLRISNTWSW